MIFRQLFDRDSSTFTYLVADERSSEAALVDPVRDQVPRDLELVQQLGLVLRYAIDTHVHADHVTAAGELRRLTGARTCIGRGHAPGDLPECADVALADGDELRLGRVVLRALETPGHTAACLSFAVGEARDGAVTFDRVLTGDALFVRGCGRTDFQGGDADSLWESVHTKLFALPDATLVFPAHDYRGMTVSTIGEERRFNPRLGGGATKEAFRATMAALHLPRPARMDEALPANRACGERRVDAADAADAPSGSRGG